jgi:hypothetical protein
MDFNKKRSNMIFDEKIEKFKMGSEISDQYGT